MVKIKITVEIQEDAGNKLGFATGEVVLPPRGLWHIARCTIEGLAGTVFGCASANMGPRRSMHEDRKV